MVVYHLCLAPDLVVTELVPFASLVGTAAGAGTLAVVGNGLDANLDGNGVISLPLVCSIKETSSCVS